LFFGAAAIPTRANVTSSEAKKRVKLFVSFGPSDRCSAAFKPIHLLTCSGFLPLRRRLLFRTILRSVVGGLILLVMQPFVKEELEQELMRNLKLAVSRTRTLSFRTRGEDEVLLLRVWVLRNASNWTWVRGSVSTCSPSTFDLKSV
jgi:hypothetical protein